MHVAQCSLCSQLCMYNILLDSCYGIHTAPNKIVALITYSIQWKSFLSPKDTYVANFLLLGEWMTIMTTITDLLSNPLGLRITSILSQSKQLNIYSYVSYMQLQITSHIRFIPVQKYNFIVVIFTIVVQLCCLFIIIQSSIATGSHLLSKIIQRPIRLRLSDPP